MQYLGDYAEDYPTLNFKFSTHKADGTPATLTGAPAAVKVYKANSTTTETATGVTLTVDFDSTTGLNNVLIDLSADSFYAVGNDYAVVITTGTVDSISVIGSVVAHFSIENRYNKTDLIKWLGTAPLALSGQQVQAVVPTTQKVDVETIKTAAVAASSTVTFANGTVSTLAAGAQMDLVNAPNATAVAAIQNGLASLAKLTKYVQLLSRKDAAIATDNSTELTAINANGGSGAGTFSNQTDAEEALSDRLPASLTTNGSIKASAVELITTLLTESAIGRLKAALTTLLDVASPVLTVASLNQTGDSYARLGTPAGGVSISDDIANIASSVAQISPATDSADSQVVNSGAVVAGSYASTQTDDDINKFTIRPDAGGINVDLIYQCGAGRSPFSVGINGYWNGSGQVVNVYAYDYELGIWDQLSNSSTRMASRNSDANYSYALNRAHMEVGTGEVSIRFVTTSTNIAHRLYLDQVVVGSYADSGSGANSGLTAQDVWQYVTRTLTDAGGEPVTAAEIAAAIGSRIAELQGNYTYDQIMSILLSALAGVTSNAGATLKTPNGVATRISATLNASNERTAMTLTP